MITPQVTSSPPVKVLGDLEDEIKGRSLQLDVSRGKYRLYMSEADLYIRTEYFPGFALYVLDAVRYERFPNRRMCIYLCNIHLVSVGASGL